MGLYRTVLALCAWLRLLQQAVAATNPLLILLLNVWTKLPWSEPSENWHSWNRKAQSAVHQMPWIVRTLTQPALQQKKFLPKSYQSWLDSRHTHDQQLFAAELTVTAEEPFESLSGRQWLLGLKRGAQNVESTSSSSSSSWLSSSNSLSNQKCYSNNVE